MAWTWEFMLQVFRGMGGTADNIDQRNGPRGRGIFPIDPAKPIRLHVPQNLLIPVSDVEFVDDRMKIKDSANVAGAVRGFFENYQDAFSWGREGRSEAIAFIKALDDLPPDVSALLSSDFAMKAQLEGGSDIERAQRWFLESRQIEKGGKGVVMPLMELVNHAPAGVPYNLGEGVAIDGSFSGEVLVHYVIADALGIFRTFGFASPERIAFSLPMKNDTGRDRILIRRKFNFDSKLGAFPVPDYGMEDDTLVLSCLVIGNAKFPRLSRGIFCRVMREAEKPDADEVFDLILHENRKKFFRLLELLEPHEGGLIPTLRRMVRYQLETMSFCIGTREL